MLINSNNSHQKNQSKMISRSTRKILRSNLDKRRQSIRNRNQYKKRRNHKKYKNSRRPRKLRKRQKSQNLKLIRRSWDKLNSCLLTE